MAVPILTPETVRAIGCYEKVEEILRGGVPIPETIELFLTNVCNYACPHCFFAANHDQAKGAFMPVELAESLLAETRQNGVRACEFSGGGEPLMHPQFVHLVESARNLGFHIGIITNGALLASPGVAQSLANHCTWIRVSLDAGTPEVYRRVHGPGANLEHVRHGITELLRTRQIHSSSVVIGVKFLASRLNAFDCDSAIELAEELGVDYISFKAAVRCKEELSPSEKWKLFEHVSSIARQRKANRMRISTSYRDTEEYPNCVLSSLHALVDWDGSIYVCPFFAHRRDRHLIGNARDGGLFTHWGGSTHRERIAAITPAECNPDCPLTKFEPVIEFIRERGDELPFF